MTGVEVRPAASRAVTRLPWLESRHAFSFGAHYDPANTSFGQLLTSNEDRVQAGAGFARHPHRDLEVVTWVLSGSLVHEDSTGVRGVVRPGQVQRMTAGRGVLHAETNDAWRLDGGPVHDEPVHLVQMWVAPDAAGLEPGYEQRDVDAELRAGGLVALASGRGRDAAVRLAQRDATLHAARLAADEAVTLPDAPYVHVQVTRGEVGLEGAGALGAGDTARCTAAGAQRLTATAPAEVLVWEMHCRLGS